MAETALIDVGVLFVAVALAGLVARRIDQSVIPFYILTGIVLGPAGLGRVDFQSLVGSDALPDGASLMLTETDFVAVGAELGIVFLLFFLGLEFNLERLLDARQKITRAGIVDLALNFPLGFALGYVLFGAFLPALLVAGVVYISSSAIITKSLIDLGWIANDEAEPMLGTLVFEDLFIAVYLAIVSALVLGGDSADAAISIGYAIVFLVILVLVGSLGTVALQRLLENRSNESIVLQAVGITLLIAGAALAVGVSEAVAAFFVGMAFSSTSHVETLERLLEPLRDVFAAVFFFWIGLVTDPLLFGAVATMIAIAVLVTTPTKLVSGFVGGRIYDLDARRSTRVAVGMTTRGEFSLIIASTALAGAGVAYSESVAAELYAFAVGYVLVMSVLGTTLMQHAHRFETPASEWFGAILPGNHS